ncbi:aminoglycoside phosphotransferase family protein [Spirochaeta isovalerica]|uniref:Streptomycin 6-kinase n=1 Tax=Spirochaeta isovalerica TaxID=150 RepID=A0A841RGV4_9SPIO|nr:aminoglycoside phosphotransferase family protein [Spirochaeta isovalerica]MBB6482437.1 streptomycin 6-kinase [Spirochaeta isovalerica]
MIPLPRKFRTNIKETFGEKGRLWLKDLPGKLDEICHIWNLTECRPVNDLSFNYVCTARSDRFGPVVLKIGVESSELENEFRSLRYLKSMHLCRGLAFDSERNAMLLERVTPGENLFSLDSPEEQIKAGASLLKDNENTETIPQGFPYYGDWLKRSFQKTRNKRAGTTTVDAFFKKAEIYWLEQANRLPETLNHGDFHHMNILRNENREWTVIDPQGVIGYQTADCGRFILNQLGRTDNENRSELLTEMSRVFAEALKTTEELVLKGAYIEQMLSCSWTLEGFISEEKERDIIEKMEAADRLYSSILNAPQGIEG